MIDCMQTAYYAITSGDRQAMRWRFLHHHQAPPLPPTTAWWMATSIFIHPDVISLL
jgi:hypothetical protein